MQQYIQQAALAGNYQLWHTSNRLLVQLPVANHPKPAGPFGDQLRAVWQEREAPGVLESLGNGFQLNTPIIGIKGLIRGGRGCGDKDSQSQCQRLVKEHKNLLVCASSRCSGFNHSTWMPFLLKLSSLGFVKIIYRLFQIIMIRINLIVSGFDL